jgi:hypothetical protein
VKKIKEQTMIYKALHRKFKIEQYEITPLKPGLNLPALEG